MTLVVVAYGLQAPCRRVHRPLAASRLDAIYKFSRPHTIRGTLLASFAGVGKALSEHPLSFDLSLVPRALVGVLVLICSNAFIVGINQIYDEDIDRINKPFLPIASGELSKPQAWALLAACGLVGPTLCYLCFPSIFALYMFGTAVGTFYSVPPIALKKRGPFFAGLAIAMCRGFLLNFGVYYATLEALNQPFKWSPSVAFLARFMTVFAAVIAVTKDLPDIEGDRKFQINTFATRLGAKKVASLATLALFLNYISAIAQGLFTDHFKRPMVIGHSLLALLLLKHYRTFINSNAVKRFYKHIWDLFYLEYALYIFI